MDDEIILSGYCRCLDDSRTVMVEDGEPDCVYETCPHKGSCDIAKRITVIVTHPERAVPADESAR